MFKEIAASESSILARKPIYGLAINDSKYNTHIVIEGKRYRCPYYCVWHDMIRRCLSDKFKAKNITYKDCSVCEEWLTFSNFRRWMEQQDWQGKQLDKDIIKPSNKIYSPENCAFISPALNCLFHASKKRPSKFQGVYPSESGRKFKAYMRTSCKSNFLGSFNSEEEAAIAYLSAKIELAKSLAKEERNLAVTKGVNLRIRKMEAEIQSIKVVTNA